MTAAIIVMFSPDRCGPQLVERDEHNGGAGMQALAKRTYQKKNYFNFRLKIFPLRPKKNLPGLILARPENK